MTKEEILDAIQKVEGISGMTVNERLFTTGLMDEYDKSKHNDPQKARFILEHLQVDKPSIDKILKFATTKRIFALVLLTAINIGLTMFLLSVLADNFMEYKKAFWLTIPIILSLTYFFSKTLSKQIANRQYQINSTLFYLTIVISVVNILILALNIYCWVDLFDGTTNTMFP
jgi:cation transport ATPase